jgi:hypothetical protein
MPYITGTHGDFMSRLNQLPSGVVDVATFVTEGIDYKNQGKLTSGHLVQLDYVARLKKFQFENTGSYLSTSLMY